MTPDAERYSRVGELFDAVVDLSPEERAALLEKQCEGDDALRRDVEILLAADAPSGSFDGQSALVIPPDLFPEETAEQLSGRRFGAYQIIREIGRGGLGAVYLAARADDEYRKEVALKLIRRGLDTDDILRRFRNERQILAQLDHPNIARLLDGGTSDDGQPYFVMEYVRGEPLAAYCDSHKLNTPQRLALFRKVCAAVTYAHQNLVIHRDLKPSNILVTAEGEPKLLDFGIAKLLTAEDEMFTQTAPGLRAMTPDYASPEQIKGERITTASDVYSLGVLLYELLSGQKPYRLKTRTTEEIARAITEQEPERPSTALARGDANSKLEVRNSKFLKGDLDNIVLMALRKEPERRYRSIAALEDDIRRYQHDLPVIARQDSLHYRAVKFMRRNKVAVAAAALVTVSLLGGLAVALTQARRARTQAWIAQEQRDTAVRATERAERTSRFMQSLLNYANPQWADNVKKRTNITVREAVTDLVARMGTQLADAPEVRADLHYTAGEIHRTHGDYRSSKDHFRQSLDLYRDVHGEHHPKVARGLFYLSLFAADLAEAEPLLQSGIAIMRQTDPANVNLPYMLEYMAFWIMAAAEPGPTAERLSEADRLLEEACTLFLAHYHEHHSAVITANNALVALARTRGNAPKAEKLWQENVTRFRQVERSREDDVRRLEETDATGYYHIYALFFLAETRLALARIAEAEELFRQVTELSSARWQADDPRVKDLTGYIQRSRAAAGAY